MRALTDMAERRGAGPLSVSDLARRQNISEKYLESIMQTLVKGGLLHAVRGHRGGYSFARAPEEITAWEVFSLTEGSMAAVGCHWDGEARCERMEQCRPLPLWQGLNRVIRDYLTRCTIADLARDGGEDLNGVDAEPADSGAGPADGGAEPAGGDAEPQNWA